METKRVTKAELNRRDQAQMAIVQERRSEIEALRQNGKKSNEIAEWLTQFGFVGTGATLNGFLPWRPTDLVTLTTKTEVPEKKKVGRPRKHQDAAARVRAFRGKAAYPGHRFDIYLAEDAVIVVRMLQKQSGLSASGVIDAVLRGALKLPVT